MDVEAVTGISENQFGALWNDDDEEIQCHKCNAESKLPKRNGLCVSPKVVRNVNGRGRTAKKEEELQDRKQCMGRARRNWMRAPEDSHPVQEMVSTLCPRQVQRSDAQERRGTGSPISLSGLYV